MTNEKTQIESKLILQLKKIAKVKLARNDAKKTLEAAEEALRTEHNDTMNVLRDCIDAIMRDLKND